MRYSCNCPEQSQGMREFDTVLNKIPVNKID